MNNSVQIRGFHKEKIFNIWALAGLLMFTFVLFVLSLNSDLALPVLAVTFGISFIALMIKYPKVWLWTLALSSFVFFRTSDLKIGIGDVIFGIFIIAATYIWLFWKIFVQREKIVETIADWLIILFYTGMLLNLGVAFLNDVPFLNWFREFALFSNILLYFPLKYYLNDKKDIIIILALFALSVGLAAADQVRMYRQIALAQAVYAYQLGTSVRLNQSLFSATIFFSLIMSLLPMKQIWRFLLWGLALASIAGLVVSFSRSFWVFVTFAMIAVFFYLSKKQKKIIIIAIGLIMFASSVTFFTFFREKADLMLQVLEHRIASTTKGTKDVSWKLRAIEYDEAMSRISEHPLFGNGLGKKIKYYVPVLHWTTITHNIHNGYLFAAFRLGIPLTLIFLIILGYNTVMAERLTRKLKDPFYKNLLLASMFSLLLLITASLLSNQFFSRDGGIILALSFAFVSIAQKKVRLKLIS